MRGGCDAKGGAASGEVAPSPSPSGSDDRPAGSRGDPGRSSRDGVGFPLESCAPFCTLWIGSVRRSREADP
ncbi:hypothetical protein F8B43_0375 [Methylorubrum populi]|uniref:Uncharacterized protein n=1 Tax=Methylorubrum populi TaxID=223967 RepID=A0A833JA94_9HYPH|nr:hypothetical protein F8B43_0375 [Methylorubrum populi]